MFKRFFRPALVFVTVLTFFMIGMPLTHSVAKDSGALIEITHGCGDANKVTFTLNNKGSSMNDAGSYVINAGAPTSFKLGTLASQDILTNATTALITVTYTTESGKSTSTVTISDSNVCEPESTVVATFVPVNSCGDGKYQATLITNAQLFWAGNDNSGSIYVLTTGKHVTIVEDPANGFVRIRWSCQLYYIRSTTIGVNFDAITKPFPPVK